MFIGLDFHGVIDRFPKEFSLLTKRWVEICGHEIHIVTGSPWDSAKPKIDDLGITYTHSFSIVDHHKSIGTPMWQKETGWFMSPEEWDKSKGDYAKKVGLDVHFEDSLKYAPWFPESCTFFHVGTNLHDDRAIVIDFLTVFDFFAKS